MPTPRRASARPIRRVSYLLAIALLAALLPAGSGLAAAATKVTAGYRDFSYGEPGAPGGDDVTADRSQSKLWFHDGIWFGVLFDPVSTTNAKFRIWKFSMATQNWTNTGVAVDDRNRSHADVLAVGNNVYVASARAAGPATATVRDLRIYKYAYNATSKTYALVAGFPKLIANTATGTSYSNIAVDGTGRLWVSYMQPSTPGVTGLTAAAKVKITTSGDGGVTWSAPFDLPNMGNDATNDDVAAITRVTGGVGVMWSNENDADDAYYFVAHVDGQPVGTWRPRETALNDTGSIYDADGHISLKTDASGNVLAAVKTSNNDDPAPNAGDPLIAVLKRTGAAGVAGTWTTHEVTDVATEGTRPVLVIDAEANQANVFLTHPDTIADGQQSIHRRTAPLGTLNFGAPALGPLFISSATETAINDATSTKQVTSAASGILVLATNIPTRHYLHNCAGTPCPAPPTANFTGTPLSGTAPLNVQFTDTSTGNPTSWSWTFGDGGTSTARNPSHAYADPGTYTVALTVSNSQGSDSETKTGYVTVSQPPETRYFTITPKRLLDTRPGINIGLTGAFKANVPRQLDVDAHPDIPDDAVAITGNLTVVGQGSGGYISITKTSQANPTTSNLNFPVGDNRANGVTVPLNDPAGGIWIVYKGSGSAHVLLDVTGYFRQVGTGGTSYTAIAPKRVLDTRPGIAIGLNGAFQANSPRSVNVAGISPIPANAKAITGNLTVVGQTKAGYLSITQTSQVNPSTSILNFPLSDVRANGVTVPLNGTGDVFIVYKASGGSAHVLLDVTGYFVEGGAGLTFVPVTPARIVDTRPGITIGLSGTFNANTPRTFDVAGQGGVGSDAEAVIGNVTVVGQTKAGYVSLTPGAQVNPTTSTLNFPLGDTRANNFTVDLANNGGLAGVYKATSGAKTHLIVDVTGYYK